MEIVSKAASSIFFFLADKEKGDLKGYMLLPDAEKSSFHVKEMWNANIPHSQQTITNIGKFIFLGGGERGVGNVLGARSGSQGLVVEKPIY